MKRILVLRFSAMGDVTLLVPVISSLVYAHEGVEITVVTRPAFASLFINLPRVKVFSADLDRKYAGFFGLRKLFGELLTRARFDLVIDVHDHLRTKVLRSFFQLFGYPVYVFRKGRAQKKAFTRKENKITTPLPHTVDRYREVFARAGFNFTMKKAPYIHTGEIARQAVAAWLGTLNLASVTARNTHEKWIGLAPFAAHATKIWPLENYVPLIAGVQQECDARFFLFGGGPREVDFFDSLVRQFPDRVFRVAGNLTLEEEFTFIPFLNLIVTVDSANMHLASLAGTSILSIWGGTHPDVGFGPYGYKEDSILQIDRHELTCRPCSTYGKATCIRGDFACLTWIKPEQVSQRILTKLNEKN